MYTIIQFSPTGNAAFIAQQMAAELKNADVLTLEHTNPSNLQKDTHLILVSAIHGFNLPRTVQRFIRQIPMGIYEHVSLIGVGCNTSWVNDSVNADARKQLKNI